MQPKLSPVVWHHPDDDFLVLGEDRAAPVAPRLPVAGAFSEIRRLAAWKATIFKAKLNQPPYEQRLHLAIMGATY